MSELKQVVKLVLENANAFEWSLQGMGMLRLYIGNNMRLHIWDSRYRVPNVSMIHDHMQWGLKSTIVAGQLRNQRYFVRSFETSGTTIHALPYNMVILKPGYGCHFKNDPTKVRLIKKSIERYGPGMHYNQMPDEVHETDAEDGTVTIMQKYPTDDESARVFWPVGEEWGSAEPRAATKEEVESITKYALEKWFGE